MTTSTLKDVNLYEVMETLAFQQAAGAASTGARHNTRIARVVPDSWQARLFRQMPELRHVRDIADCERAMAEAGAPVLFIGDAVTIDAAALARICAASGHDKTIIWEDGGVA